ncbi:flavin-dependent oxidoreductase [Actinomadura napierensis]|uniref:Flavin-dependent oxidoreductase n=1 Tax=Actinomadura napierensis TaxID=267854 RepID=A0ABN2ZEH2_9ACTN
MRVLIVGAGIGGLATALSLHEAGIEALVVDGVRRLRPLGVGINLLPHAVRELTELGLGGDLADIGVPTAEMVHFDRFGGRIWADPRGRALGYDWPQYSVHRGELQMVLLDAVLSRLGKGAVRTGTVFEGFEQDGAGVRVRLLDRASGTAETVRADVLVGADGLHSAVRARLYPDEQAPLWNGIRMWRGVTESEPFLTGRTLAVAGSNAASKMVVYPISMRAERRGKALLNWVAEVNTAFAGGSGGSSPQNDAPGDRLETAADWNRTGRLEDVLPHFAGWTFDWLDVPALIAASPEILEYPMVDREPLDRWTFGRVTLLGDAAHPMYPIGSNGGSQAVLDARVLAYELARAADPGEGLLGYERERRETVNAVVLACRDMPAERILRMVGERAPDGFEAIEDVLTPDELTTLTGAYRRTSFIDAETLNGRPSYTVVR